MNSEALSGINIQIQNINAAFEGLEDTIKQLNADFQELGKTIQNDGGNLQSFTDAFKPLETISEISGIIDVVLQLNKLINLDYGKAANGITVLIGKITGSGGLSGALSALGGAGGVAAVAGVIIVLGAVIYDAVKNSEHFRSSLVNLKDSFIEFGNAFMELIQPVFDTIRDVYEQVLLPLLEILWAILEPIIQLINQFLRLNIQMMIDGIATTLSVLTSLLQGDFKGALDQLGGWIDIVIGNFNEFKDNVINAFQNSAAVIGEKVEQIKVFLQEKLSQAINSIVTFLTELPGKVGALLGTVVGVFIKFVADVGTALSQAPMKFATAIGKFVTETLPNWINSVKTWCSTEIPKLIMEIANFFLTLPDKILGVLSGLKDRFLEIGKNVLQGIIDGLCNIGSALNNFKNSFIGSIKNVLGIHSPARVIIDAKIGNFVTDGIVVGMEEEIPGLKTVAQKMVNIVEGTFSRGDYNFIMPDYEALNDRLNVESSINRNIDCSMIERASYAGFMRAIQEYGLVQVQVNARTEKGTIVETAIDGIKKEIIRTGEVPFPIV